MLHEVGLEAALEWLAERIQERHGIHVRFEDDEQPKASDENVRVLLFHAVHELLMNVIKHANASQALVAVRKREEQVEIHVEDDGLGFDMEGVRVRSDKTEASACSASGSGCMSSGQLRDELEPRLRKSGDASGTAAAHDRGHDAAGSLALLVIRLVEVGVGASAQRALRLPGQCG
jgi:hypothetical protein